jgi:hypothetical protein
MTMDAPAIDYQGSGALQYLRAEFAERREIHLLLPGWSWYVPNSNSISVDTTIAITRSQPDFEARRNLQNVQEIIRLSAGRLPAADLEAAQRALERLQARDREDVNAWAAKLGADLSVHND